MFLYLDDYVILDVLLVVLIYQWPIRIILRDSLASSITLELTRLCSLRNNE